MATTETSGQRLERLKSIVPGLTNDVIGEWFGLTAQAVQKWTKAEVPRNRFATIVEKTGVAEEWLVLGKGEPFPRDDEDALPAATGAQMQLAENVRILRERAGMTQAELAEKLGKGQTTIFKIENGQTLRPRFMDELAQALGVSRIQLEFGTPDAAPQPVAEENIPALVTPIAQSTGYGDVPTPLHKPESNIGSPGRYRTWSSNDPLPPDEFIYLRYKKEVAFRGGDGSIEMEDYNDYKLPFARATMYRAQYRGRITQQMGGARLVRGEHVSAGLYLARYRLLAYDLADRFHYNRVGAGLPYYRQSISGLHRHFWIDEGDGYAEPLTLTDTSAGGIIKAFLQESNITIPGGVKPVPREQYSLPL